MSIMCSFYFTVDSSKNQKVEAQKLFLEMYQYTNFWMVKHGELLP